ncbi:unnamed protein product [Caenorhabditis auriculariae]|uniref:Neurotransmitter-gated ion-channel transmembrane domain-containing protein n=1 Tax=Caenorhabditis auriculariae TaxID=2777116 RepID=A0A8S1HPF5_9PELO|nr:unnamed protein product [Caenorhabditis auriculariae]
MMVFCSLLEYAAVGYINKRMKLVKKRKESRAVPFLPSSPPSEAPSRALSVPSYFHTNGYRPFYSSTDRSSNLYIPEAQRTPMIVTTDECQCNLTVEDPFPNHARMSHASVVLFKPDLPKRQRFCKPSLRWFRPSNIDKYSRSIFPTVFVIFNIAYWSYFIRISQLEERQNNIL